MNRLCTHWLRALPAKYQFIDQLSKPICTKKNSHPFALPPGKKVVHYTKY